MTDKIYTAKTLFHAYRLGFKEKAWCIGIPKKYWKDGKVKARYQDKVREFEKKQIIGEHEQKDKFRPGNFTLCYVVWNRKDA